MAFQKSFLNGRLVLIACLVIQNLAKINCQLSSNWPVIEYDYNVGIRFLFEDNILMGECAISMHIQHALQSIKLNSVFIQIIDIFLIDSEYGLVYEVSLATNYNNTLTIDFSNEVPPATYILSIKYMRFINESYTNFFVSRFDYEKNIAEQKLSQTGVEIMKNRQLFPFFDSVNRSRLKIAIKHHKRYVILSNMPIREQYKNDKNDIVWTYFNEILLFPEYLSIVITTFTNVSSYLGNVTIWCRESAQQYVRYAIFVVEKILPYFKQRYMMNLSKLDIVALWHSDDENDATFGLLLQQEADIIFDKNVHSIVRRREVAHMIARQLAFLWCEDTVFWSKEGFVTFFATQILNEVYPDKHIMDLMIVQAQDSKRYDVSSVEYSSTLKSTNIFEVSLEPLLNYMKSFIIWRMLYHILGDDAFWTAIRKYNNIDLSNIIYTNMTTSDVLWAIMQTTYIEKYPNHTFINYFEEMISNLTTKKFYAVLKGTPDAIYYICSDLLNNDKEIWILPLTYTSQSDSNFNLSHINMIKINAQSHWTYDLKRKDWFIINIKLVGYYRVNYDIENWEKLMHSLNFEDYNNIHILNRAQIIDDAFYFFLQRNLTFDLFWNLTNFVTRDTNFVTWYPMLKVFEFLTCVYPLERGNIITKKIRNRIQLLLAKIGYSRRENDTALIIYLRQEALKWACILRISQCQKMAISKFEKAFENSTEIRWIYCRALLTTVKDATWHEIRNKWIATSDKRYLEYLTCFESSQIICYFLRITIEEVKSNDKKKTNRRVSAFLSTIIKHAGNDKLCSCLFEIIKQPIFALSSNKEIDIIATLIVIITHVHEENHIAMIRKNAKNILNKSLFEFFIKRIKKRKFEYGRLIRNYGNCFSTSLKKAKYDMTSKIFK